MNIVSLGGVCQIVNGGTPKSGVADYWDGGIAWLTPAQMGKLDSPLIGETDRTITEAGLAKSSAKLVPPASVILSTRAPIGHLAINEVPMAFNQGCRGLVPGDKLDTSYLYYYLYHSRDALDALGSGTTFKELAASRLKEFPIPVPPLAEQRRIVAILDEAFAGIANATANAEKKLANARECRNRLHQKAFADVGDRQVLGEIATFRNGVNFTASSRGEQIRIVGVKDFQDNLEVPVEGLAMVHLDGSLPDSDLLEPGDILTVRSNGNKSLIGRCMIASKVKERTTHSGFTIRIRPDVKRINSDYLCRYLKSPEARAKLVAAGAGANISSLSQKVLSSLTIPLPSENEQRATVAKLDAADELIIALESSARSKLELLAALKQSFLQRAFAGELTTQRVNVATPSNDNFATPRFAAQVLAFAYSRHVALGRSANFGHVKAQKTLHAVEAIGRLDLGRHPIKDAAGPNDFAHMRLAEDWARRQRFFQFVQRTNGGYNFHRLENYDKLLAEATERLDRLDGAKGAVELLLDMDSGWAEIVVTTHAAWNNLILDQAAITDDAIVQAARDEWHRDKLRFDKSRFHDAIRFIRNSGIEPDGSAKRVGGQQKLPF